MYGDATKINLPLSHYATKILKMYLKFPDNQPFTAMDWKAGDGTFLDSLTSAPGLDRYLYGLSENPMDCRAMNQKNFHKTSQSYYKSEAKITNESFSMMIVKPDVHGHIIDKMFNEVDPYTMPNFEEETRRKVIREEQLKKEMKEQMKNQIDFGKLDENNEEIVVSEEEQEEDSKKLEKKIRTELEKRIRTWRMAMKEQQKQIQGLRWDGFLLQRATNYLRPGGILVMVTPKELIDDHIAYKLVNNYEDIKIIRLDNEEYREYRQCIILAKKRKKSNRENHALAKRIARTKEKPYQSFGEIREITVDKSDERYEAQEMRARVDAIYDVLEPQVEPSYIIPAGSIEDIPMFRVGPITPQEAMLTLQKSKLMQTYQEKYAQTFTNKEPVTPTPLHKGHIMLLLTSGLLNGYIGTGPDQHLIKGSAVKDVREFSEEDEDGIDKIVEREFYNISVKILDAKGNFRKIM